MNWASPVELAGEYSVSRDAIYRHAWALNLVDVPRRNVRAALEWIIEQARCGSERCCRSERSQRLRQDQRQGRTGEALADGQSECAL